MNKKLEALTLITVAAVAFAVGFYAPKAWLGHKEPEYSANVFVIFETASGTHSRQIGNVITNIGERYARNILGFDNVTSNNATKWISLGNATAGTSLTKLTTEATSSGFERALATDVSWMNGTDYAYNMSHKFTASATIRVDATGLHWNPTGDSDNNMFACADITATTFESNDNCTITWVITCDGN